MADLIFVLIADGALPAAGAVVAVAPICGDERALDELAALLTLTSGTKPTKNHTNLIIRTLIGVYRQSFVNANKNIHLKIVLTFS